MTVTTISPAVRSWLRLSMAALMSVSCVSPPRAETSVAPTSRVAEVYATLVDSAYTRPTPDTLLVAESTVAFRIPPVGTRSEWRRKYDSIPAELPAALAAASRSKRPSSELPLPRPVRFIAHAELTEIFARGVGEGWQEFYRRYPRQRNYLAFSPVVFSADSVDALVYLEYHCGGLCGGGDLYWLTRTGNGRGWRVQKKVMFWVS
jgi:hypothetical protein